VYILVGALTRSPALTFVDLSLNRMGPRAVVPLREVARNSLTCALLMEVEVEHRCAWL
jgi:hypothetical protein